jgi:HEAT repeat protein
VPKQRAILVGCVALVCFLIFEFVRSPRSRLIIEGEPVEVWIRQLASDTWREHAKRALISAGLPVLPHVARAFEKADSFPHRAQSKLHNFNDTTAQMVNAPFPWERIRADLAEVMGAVGSNYRFTHGVNAGPAPVQLQIAVDGLTRGLQDTNSESREGFAQELWRIGPHAQSAVPALLLALQNKDLRETKVFGALGNIGPGPYTNEVLHALGKGLRAKDPAIVLSAIEALSGMSDSAASAVPALVQLMEDSDDRIANAALRTMARIGHLPSQVKPKLEKLITLPDEFRRAGAAVALLRIEPGNAKALTLVRECLETTKPANLRSSTVYLLGGMGREAKIFENDLRQLEHDRDGNVAGFARDILNTLRSDDAQKR